METKASGSKSSPNPVCRGGAMYGARPGMNIILISPLYLPISPLYPLYPLPIPYIPYLSPIQHKGDGVAAALQGLLFDFRTWGCCSPSVLLYLLQQLVITMSSSPAAADSLYRSIGIQRTSIPYMSPISLLSPIYPLPPVYPLYLPYISLIPYI